MPPRVARALALRERMRRAHLVLPRREHGAGLDGHKALVRNGSGAAGKQPAGAGEAAAESDHCAGARGTDCDEKRRESARGQPPRENGSRQRSGARGMMRQPEICLLLRDEHLQDLTPGSGLLSPASHPQVHPQRARQGDLGLLPHRPCDPWRAGGCLCQPPFRCPANGMAGRLPGREDDSLAPGTTLRATCRGTEGPRCGRWCVKLHLVARGRR
jgi:hypothetical protein